MRGMGIERLIKLRCGRMAGCLLLMALSAMGCASAPARSSGTTLRSERPRILFIGSSSILYWKTLENDFGDVQGTIMRDGKGDRTLADIAAHVQDQIINKSPDKVLIYAGSHDLHVHQRTPSQVIDDFAHLCKQVHAALPQTKVYFISCKPSIAKWDSIGMDQELNAMVRQFTNDHNEVIYIDVWTPMLDFDGQPAALLFAQDKNHLSKEGYKVWKRAIRPYIVN